MSTPLVSLRQVRKDYRRFTLGPLDLDLSAGRVCGLVGPNGAGKSTLLRILMGLVRPDAGQVDVAGRRLPRDLAAIKDSLGFVAEDVRLHASRSLRWHADVARSLRDGWDEPYAAALADRLELSFGQRGGEMSRGQAVKAMLLLALAARPRLLLLDEPTAGLDPLARLALLEELARVVREERLTVLFSSHLTGDIEVLADDVAFLHGGRIVEKGACADLVRRGAAAATGAERADGGALAAVFRRHADPEARHAV